MPSYITSLMTSLMTSLFSLSRGFTFENRREDMRLHEDMGRSFSRVTPAFVFLLSLARSSHAAVISACIMHEKNDRSEVHAELREDF